MTYRAFFVDLDIPSRQAELGARWNALWHSSGSGFPLSRWEQLQLWHEHFASRRRLRACVVERDDRWVAALPLVSCRLHRLFPIWEVPQNDWTGAFELLVCQDAVNDAQVYDQLTTALLQLRRPLLRISEISANADCNAAFRQSLVRAKLTIDDVPRHDVGIIEIGGKNSPASWESYQAAWSGNFRRQMRKMMRRAEELGGVELTMHQPKDAGEVERLVREGFAIEDRGWKGTGGTSVVRSPGMVQYFIRQAQLLAEQGELLLLFLQHAGQPIAFEYGWSHRRIYYSPKVGYDEQFSHLSPGQVLRLLWLEKLFRDQTHDALDFAGPLADATQKWTTRQYPRHRWIVGLNAMGNGLIRGQRITARLRSSARGWLDQIRQSTSRSPQTQSVPAPAVTSSTVD